MEYNRYPAGYAPIRRSFQSARTAELYAETAVKKIQELIKPTSNDINVLDFGCGPGAITLGLAKLLKDNDRSKVTGIDKEPSEIAYAISQANERGISNIEFFTENIYKFETNGTDNFTLPEKNSGKIELSFKNDTFDLVHSHAVLDYFKEDDAEKVMSELLRVCKSDGTVVISLPKWDDLAFDFSAKGEPLAVKHEDEQYELVKAFHRRYKDRIVEKTEIAFREAEFYKNAFNKLLGSSNAVEIPRDLPIEHRNINNSKLLDLWVCLFINNLTGDLDSYTKSNLFEEIKAVCQWSRNPEACVFESWYEIVVYKK